MNIVIADPSTDAPPRLATNATVSPTPLAGQAVRDVLLSARKVRGAAQLPRANLQVSGSSQQQPTLPFAPSSATHVPSILTYSVTSTPRTSGPSTAAKETIAKLISQATSLDYKEVRLDGVSRQFLAGHLSSDEIEAFKLRLNQRREQQNAICILFAALVREMIVDRYEIVGRSFSMMRWVRDPAVVYNMELITKCFPLLGVPVDEFAFEWPAVYLAYAMGFAATKGRPVSSAMLMRVGAGVGIIAERPGPSHWNRVCGRTGRAPCTKIHRVEKEATGRDDVAVDYFIVQVTPEEPWTAIDACTQECLWAMPQES
jgi:hypothetical protein